MKKKCDINRFSFAQMTSNSDGKTSGSGTMGALTVSVGLLGFLAGVIDFMVQGKPDVMTWSITVITLGIGLMGYRKSKDGLYDETEELEDEFGNH